MRLRDITNNGTDEEDDQSRLLDSGRLLKGQPRSYRIYIILVVVFALGVLGHEAYNRFIAEASKPKGAALQNLLAASRGVHESMKSVIAAAKSVEGGIQNLLASSKIVQDGMKDVLATAKYVQSGLHNPHAESYLAYNGCPFGNIDIFIVLREQDFPLLTHVLRSIDIFMPCYGHLHIVANEGDDWKLKTWMKLDDRVHFYRFLDLVPERLKFIQPRELMNYVMMMADEKIKPRPAENRALPDYIMFLDTDSIFALPVTCRSLFDDEGKIFASYYRWEKPAPQFASQCADFIGGDKECVGNFMAMFPMLYKYSLFAAARAHMAQYYGKRRNMTFATFDDALAEWARQPRTEISQFVLLGNYAHSFTNDQHSVKFDTLLRASGDALRYVPPGLHFAWRPAHDLDAMVPEQLDIEHDSMPYYSRKYNRNALHLIQNVTHRGSCFQFWLQSNRTRFAPNCDSEMSTTIYYETNPYAKKQLDMEWIYEHYTPTPVPGPLCDEKFKRLNNRK